MEVFGNHELVVSPYWTPEHLDVTYLPITYARPKAPWIDGFKRLRPHLSSDKFERAARRRLHTHSVVDPAEITILPPLGNGTVTEKKAHRFTWRAILGPVHHRHA